MLNLLIWEIGRIVGEVLEGSVDILSLFVWEIGGEVVEDSVVDILTLLIWEICGIVGVVVEGGVDILSLLIWEVIGEVVNLLLIWEIIGEIGKVVEVVNNFVFLLTWEIIGEIGGGEIVDGVDIMDAGSLPLFLHRILAEVELLGMAGNLGWRSCYHHMSWNAPPIAFSKSNKPR